MDVDKCLILDTSIASDNKGDDIILECFRKEMDFILSRKFVLNLPTHVSAFHWYQVWRNSAALQRYSNCKLKFVAGTNLLVKDLLTHYPQWNINLFNCKPFVGTILTGVGAGAGDKTNRYTREVYKRVLSDEFIHSVRDERSKEFVESLGKRVLNTGCVTMWMFTPEFCKSIPVKKANNVVFTLTPRPGEEDKDRFLIRLLKEMYNNVFYWIQGDKDYDWFMHLGLTDGVEIINPTIVDYHQKLLQPDLDYVGTRLHAGIYAMRHKRRSIIIAIDERAREINKSNNLVCLERKDVEAELENLITSDFKTEIKMPFDIIAQWKSQFEDL